MNALEEHDMSAYARTLAPNYIYKEVGGRVVSRKEHITQEALWLKTDGNTHVKINVKSVQQSAGKTTIIVVRSVTTSGGFRPPDVETVMETWVLKSGIPILQSTVVGGSQDTNRSHNNRLDVHPWAPRNPIKHP